MDENEWYIKLSEKIDRVLDKLDTKFSAFDEKLHDHEVRIVVLEKQPAEAKKDWKNEVIMLLVKALIIGGVSIASLVGAGGLLGKMIGG